MEVSFGRKARKFVEYKAVDLTNDRCQRRGQCSRITVSFFTGRYRAVSLCFEASKTSLTTRFRTFARTENGLVKRIRDVTAARRRGYHQHCSLIVGVEAASP